MSRHGPWFAFPDSDPAITDHEPLITLQPRQRPRTHGPCDGSGRAGGASGPSPGCEREYRFGERRTLRADVFPRAVGTCARAEAPATLFSALPTRPREAGRDLRSRSPERRQFPAVRPFCRATALARCLSSNPSCNRSRRDKLARPCALPLRRDEGSVRAFSGMLGRLGRETRNAHDSLGLGGRVRIAGPSERTSRA